MKKRIRSQAGIITAVLLIVIVIIAIVVVWSVILPLIRESSDEAGTGSISVQMSIEEVKLWITGDAEVKVKRGSGEGDLAGLKFNFYDDDGNSWSVERQDVLNEVQSKLYRFTYNEIGTAKIEKVSVAPIFKNGKFGREIYEPEDAIRKDDDGNRLVYVNENFMMPSEPLVSWWRFEEGSGNIAKDSVKDNDGDITGASWLNDPERGIVLDFDNVGGGASGDYVNIASPSGLSTSEMTISAWINPDVVDPSERQAFVTVDYMSFFDIHPSGIVRSFFRNNTGSWVISSSTGPINAGEWIYVAQVFDGSENKLYINGVLNNSVIASGSLFNDGSSIRIGDATWGGEAFDGKIDDVMIFNKALNQNQISVLYQSQK